MLVPFSSSGTALDTAKLAEIAGHEGEQTGAVYKITVGRDDLGMKEHGAVINAHGTQHVGCLHRDTRGRRDYRRRGDARNGSYTRLEGASQNGLDVVAIHHHMTDERPVVIFLHYWGRGPAEKLAAGFKAALDELGRGDAAHGSH